MNKIINKFLLAGNKFMPEIQPRFTYSVCGPFTCFQHGIAYGDFKYVRTLAPLVYKFFDKNLLVE